MVQLIPAQLAISVQRAPVQSAVPTAPSLELARVSFR